MIGLLSFVLFQTETAGLMSCFCCVVVSPEMVHLQLMLVIRY